MKMESVQNLSHLTLVVSPVEKSLILICEKCGQKISSDQNPAKKIRGLLKNRIKKSGERKSYRVVLTDCLDICPKGEITMAIPTVLELNGGSVYFTSRSKAKEIVEEVAKLLNLN